MISLDLQQQGYRVVTASNGEDAITVATQMLPNLILMDINLPTLDGLGATRRIRENDALREVPVIAITAFGTEGFQRAAYDAGVSGYLTKPFDLDRMHQLIARLLSPGGSGSGQTGDVLTLKIFDRRSVLKLHQHQSYRRVADVLGPVRYGITINDVACFEFCLSHSSIGSMIAKLSPSIT